MSKPIITIFRDGYSEEMSKPNIIIFRGGYSGEIYYIDFPQQVWDWCNKLPDSLFRSGKQPGLAVECWKYGDPSTFCEGILFLESPCVNFGSSKSFEWCDDHPNCKDITREQIHQLVGELCDAYFVAHRGEELWVKLKPDFKHLSTQVSMSLDFLEKLKYMACVTLGFSVDDHTFYGVELATEMTIPWRDENSFTELCEKFRRIKELMLESELTI